MKKHELKAKYQAKTIEILNVAYSSSNRVQVAHEVMAAEKTLHKRILNAMDTALSIYSDLDDALRREFDGHEYAPYEYIDDQSLNILQKCVGMCIPGTTRARPLAYVLYSAYGEGYVDDNVEEYVDEFYGGLEDAIKIAEEEMGGSPYYSYYASEDEFPSDLPQQLNTST